MSQRLSELRVTVADVGTLVDEAKRAERLLSAPYIRALADREQVERMLRFANSSTAREAEELLDASAGAAMGYLVDLEAPADTQRKLRASLPQIVNPVRDWWTRAAPEREWWRETLAIVIDGAAAERAQLAAEAQRIRDNDLLVIASPRWTGRESTIELRHFAQTLKAACAHVALLLLDQGRLKKIGGTVRRCAYEPCSEFFLSTAPKGGGPRPRYCRPEHRIEAVALSGPERTQRWRDRKRAAKHK